MRWRGSESEGQIFYPDSKGGTSNTSVLGYGPHMVHESFHPRTGGSVGTPPVPVSDLSRQSGPVEHMSLVRTVTGLRRRSLPLRNLEVYDYRAPTAATTPLTPTHTSATASPIKTTDSRPVRDCKSVRSCPNRFVTRIETLRPPPLTHSRGSIETIPLLRGQ